MREALRPSGKLFGQAGSSSAKREALRPRGKLFSRVGGSSRAPEALRPRRRLFVPVGGSSFAWETLRTHRKLFIRAGGSSHAPEVLPTRRTFLPHAGCSSHVPEAPRTRATSGGRAPEACSLRVGPRWYRSTLPHLFVPTRRAKSSCMTPMGQRRRESGNAGGAGRVSRLVASRRKRRSAMARKASGVPKEKPPITSDPRGAPPVTVHGLGLPYDPAVTQRGMAAPRRPSCAAPRCAAGARVAFCDNLGHRGALDRRLAGSVRAAARALLLDHTLHGASQV